MKDSKTPVADPKVVLGARIREARARVGISQTELALATGFQHAQIVSQIENGERDVKAFELVEIASALHTQMSDLLKEAPILEPSVLWREQPAGNSKPIETEFLELCRNYALVEKLAGVKYRAKLPEVDSESECLGFDGVAALASHISKQLDLGMAPATALTKILEEDYGVKIFYKDHLAGSAASAVGDFGQAILMNSAESPWRRNYNFAHEVFHLSTWSVLSPEKLRTDEDLKKKCEKLANYFASCLLLPADAVLSSFRERSTEKGISYADLINIAREFDVSTEALIWRLVNLRQIDPSQATKVLDDAEFRELDRGTMSGRWWQPSDLSERYVRLSLLCYQKKQLSRAKLAELLGISLEGLRERLRPSEQRAGEAELCIA